jgi:hypothetical protein
MAGFLKKFAHRKPSREAEKEPLADRAIVGVSTSITAFIGGARDGPVNRPTLIHGFGEFDRIFGGLWERGTLSFAVQQYYLNGGRDALIVRVNASEGSRVSDADLVGSRDRKSGIHALDASTFNLLCLPPPAPGLDVTPATWATTADHCRARRAFLLVDPPAAARDPAAATSWLTGLPAMAGENAAVFFPRVPQRYGARRVEGGGGSGGRPEGGAGACVQPKRRRERPAQ